MKQMIQRLLAVVLCLFTTVSLLSVTVSARDLVDTEKKTSLSLEYLLDGAEFSLYHVGAISATSELSLTGDFKEYKISLEQDQDGWRGLAQTLETYVVKDQLEPLITAKTNAQGNLTFSDLTVGLYLVTGKPSIKDHSTYTPQPFLICLPNLYTESDPWTYDVTASPKCLREMDSSKDDTLTRKVLKVWNDRGNNNSRPDSIEVQLLCDGRVWDTVSLNANDNWSHTWTGLASGHTWSLLERTVPDDYTVVIERQGITFVVTNTKKSQNEGQPIQIPEDPVPGGSGPGLPQTGMLWWPVGVLGCSGMGLLLVGWVRRKNDEQK